MPVNWLLEAKKWQLLINKLEPISLWTSFKAILSGITLGVITPYRLGDYAGRLIVLRKIEPIKAIAVTVVGNFAQIIVTVIAGLASFCIYWFQYSHLNNYVLAILYVSSAIICYLLVDLYFLINLTSNFFKKFSYYKKVSRYVEALDNYNHKELLALLLLSLLRYMVFTAQYLILLSMFGIHVPVFTAIILITMLFLIQAVIPSITIVELGVRGSLVLYIFWAFTANTLGVLSASFVLWLINLIVPAIVGSILIFKSNNFKSSAA